MLRLVTSVASMTSQNIKMLKSNIKSTDAAQGRIDGPDGASLVFDLKQTDSGGNGRRSSHMLWHWTWDAGMSLVPRV